MITLLLVKDKKLYIHHTRRRKIAPRTKRIFLVQASVEEADLISEKLELSKNVFIGVSITRIQNKKGYITILNASNKEVTIDKNTLIKFDYLQNYEAAETRETANKRKVNHIIEQRNDRVEKIMEMTDLSNAANE